MTTRRFKCLQFRKGTLDFNFECINLLQNDFCKQRYITLNATISGKDRIYSKTHLCRTFFAEYTYHCHTFHVHCNHLDSRFLELPVQGMVHYYLISTMQDSLAAQTDTLTPFHSLHCLPTPDRLRAANDVTKRVIFKMKIAVIFCCFDYSISVPKIQL